MPKFRFVNAFGKVRVMDYVFAVNYPEKNKYWVILKLVNGCSMIFDVEIDKFEFIGEHVLKSEAEAEKIVDDIYFQSEREKKSA